MKPYCNCWDLYYQVSIVKEEKLFSYSMQTCLNPFSNKGRDRYVVMRGTIKRHQSKTLVNAPLFHRLMWHLAKIRYASPHSKKLNTKRLYENYSFEVLGEGVFIFVSTFLIPIFIIFIFFLFIGELTQKNMAKQWVSQQRKRKHRSFLQFCALHIFLIWIPHLKQF